MAMNLEMKMNAATVFIAYIVNVPAHNSFTFTFRILKPVTLFLTLSLFGLSPPLSLSRNNISRSLPCTADVT